MSIADDMTTLATDLATIETTLAQHGTRLDAVEALQSAVPASTPTTIPAIDQAAWDAIMSRVSVVEAILGNAKAAFSGATVTGGSGTGGTGTGTGGTPASPPPGGSDDPNVYPFTMPADLPAGALFEAGTGPNILEIDAANNPMDAGRNCTFAAKVNGVVIAAPLTITSNAGASLAQSQRFVFHGPWGKNPKVDLIPVAPGGVGGMWTNAMAVDFNPLVFNGVADSRGGVAVNAPVVFNSAAVATTWTLPIAVQASPPPVAQTSISGAIINGAAAQAGTLDKLAGAATTGTLLLPSGTIVGTAPLAAAITLEGQGQGKTIIDGNGVPITYNKGLIVPLVSGSTIKSLTLSGAKLSEALGGNGAGVRQNGANIDFTLDDVEITGCDDGILTFPGNVTIKNGCNIHGNGSGSGYTHNVYAGGDSNSTLTLQGSATSACNGGHEIKSRCGTTISDGCTHTTGGMGSCYDVPDGGYVKITNGVWTLPAGSADRNVFTYAMESTKNSDLVENGHTCDIGPLVINDLNGQGFNFVTNDPKAILNLTGVTYKGAVAPIIQGWGTVNGEITEAAA